MAGKTFRSTAFKRAIDVGKITTVGADDLVKIWRTATGDEKAISLGDLEVGIAEGLVPYVGAISDVDLGDNSLLVESVTLNPAPVTIPTAQGSMYFDEDEQTLAVILNGVTQKVGEDNFFQVKNQTGATIPKGTAVRFDGVVGASGRIKVVPFLANGTYPSLYCAGVTDEEILDGGDGKSYILGKVRGLNTNAYPIGTILYCSSTVAGGFTSTPPIAPNNIISVAAVIAQSATVGTLLIRPQVASNINYDEGVKIVSGTTGDILQLQASGLWENVTVASIIDGQVPIRQVFVYSVTNVFSLSYSNPTAIYVSLNGQVLEQGGLYDWTISGTSLTVTTPLRAGDEISILYYTALPTVTNYGRNIDGGAPDSVYLAIQNVDGGTP